MDKEILDRLLKFNGPKEVCAICRGLISSKPESKEELLLFGMMEDHIVREVDFNDIFQNGVSTWMIDQKDDSMAGFILKGDILQFDSISKPKDGDIVAYFIEEDFEIRILKIHKNFIELVPINKRFTSKRLNQYLNERCLGVLRNIHRNVWRK